MRHALRVRFWLEASLAAVTGILSIVTLLWPDWIELALHVDPDASSGALEWLVVGIFFALSALLSILARAEWRRMRPVPVYVKKD